MTLPKPSTRFFWGWLWHEGLACFLDRWLVLHVGLGCALAFAVERPLAELASAVLLPMASVLVGLTFAWSGNVASLLQTKEIQRVVDRRKPKQFLRWVFGFQTAVLAVLVTTAAWSMVGLGAFSRVGTLVPSLRPLGRGLLFAFTSLTLRECWQVVVGAQQLLISQMEIAAKERDAQRAAEVSALERRANQALVRSPEEVRIAHDLPSAAELRGADDTVAEAGEVPAGLSPTRQGV